MRESRVMEMLIKMYQDFNNHFNVSCHRRCQKFPHTHFFLKLKQRKIKMMKHHFGRATRRDQKPLIVKIQEVKTFIKFPTKPQTSLANLVLLEH